MALVNIPRKIVTSELTADEFNLLVDAVNEVDENSKEVTHAFSEQHFKEEGTTSVGGKAVPVLIVNPAMFNPNHFDIIDGIVSIKQSILDGIG